MVLLRWVCIGARSGAKVEGRKDSVGFKVFIYEGKIEGLKRSKWVCVLRHGKEKTAVAKEVAEDVFGGQSELWFFGVVSWVMVMSVGYIWGVTAVVKWGRGGRFSGRDVGVLEKKKVLFFKGACRFLEKKRSLVGFFCVTSWEKQTQYFFVNEVSGKRKFLFFQLSFIHFPCDRWKTSSFISGVWSLWEGGSTYYIFLMICWLDKQNRNVNLWLVKKRKWG